MGNEKSSTFKIPAFGRVEAEAMMEEYGYCKHSDCRALVLAAHARGWKEALAALTPPVDAVPGEPVARDWELTCDECAGTGKVDVSEALHVDGRYMGDQLLRETCNACTGYGFTICVADIPKEIQQ